MMNVRVSHVTHVSDFQESINNKTLEELKWFVLDWYAPTSSDERLSTTEILNDVCIVFP